MVEHLLTSRSANAELYLSCLLRYTSLYFNIFIELSAEPSLSFLYLVIFLFSHILLEMSISVLNSMFSPLAADCIVNIWSCYLVSLVQSKYKLTLHDFLCLEGQSSFLLAMSVTSYFASLISTVNIYTCKSTIRYYIWMLPMYQMHQPNR